MITSSGPKCDVCGKPITGVDGREMEIWTWPKSIGGLTFCFHENGKCNKGRMVDFKETVLGGIIARLIQTIPDGLTLGKASAIVCEVVNGEISTARLPGKHACRLIFAMPHGPEAAVRVGFDGKAVKGHAGTLPSRGVSPSGATKPGGSKSSSWPGSRPGM